MPIFEYVCESCGTQFEKMTSHAKADEVACVTCESAQTRRQLSLFGVSVAAASRPSPCASGRCAMPESGPGSGCGTGVCPGMMN